MLVGISNLLISNFCIPKNHAEGRTVVLHIFIPARQVEEPVSEFQVSLARAKFQDN